MNVLIILVLMHFSIQTPSKKISTQVKTENGNSAISHSIRSIKGILLALSTLTKLYYERSIISESYSLFNIVDSFGKSVSSSANSWYKKVG